MLKRLLKDEKGSTLMIVTMSLMVVFAFTMTFIMIAGTSSRQTFGEENKTQAYYIAKTGAESLVKHLEKQKDIKKEIEELRGKGEGKGEYGGGKYTITIDKDPNEENKYEIKSTGEIKGVEDWIIAELTLDESGGGWEIGDGKIFMTNAGNGTLQIQNLSQFKGTSLSIYTLNEKVTQINDPTSSYKKTEYKEGTSVVRRTFEKDGDIVEFNLKTNQQDILEYFSKGAISGESLTDTQIEQGLKNMFLLPIRTKQEYANYISSGKVYPDSPSYTPLAYSDTISNLTASKPLSGPRAISLSEKGDAIFKGGININNGGDLTINTTGDTDVKIDGNIRMGDSTKRDKLTIKADGKVNFYITGDVQLSGDVMVEGDNAEVNFYMTGKTFQINNSTKIEGNGINLYGPSTDTQLGNNIKYTGAIVAKNLEFNDTALFRAPSKGSATSNMNKETKLKSIEWKRQ